MTGNKRNGWRGMVAPTAALAALIILCVVSALSGISGAQSAQPAPNNAKLATLQWIPIAAVGVLGIIGAAAAVYILAGLVNSQNARNWGRMQVYEGLLSIVMILVFASFSYLFTLSPQHAFSSMHLVPSECTGATTIQTLGTCDMATFNSAAFEISNYAYVLGVLAGFVPDLRLTVRPIYGQPSLTITSRIKGLSAWSASGLFGKGLSALLFVLILSQVQLILLSASTFFFTFFMALGLISRTFGFTRAFGGSMIALGLGLGIIYPLVTAITFGFIDTSTFLPSIQCLASGSAQCFINTLESFPNMIWGLLLSIPSIAADPTSGISSLIMSIGYFVAGFTFIPFLNFVIVDTFIVDFSKAIGERMDFMSLLTTLV
ncbi:MAG: hypothetical protein KGH66_01115 [Candidatus Micrarchaeota archaeon]|nr:hypothetical protein [Candidatus Micrarchaeota archaeon]